MCHRWRRAFLQYAPLWSQLYLTWKTNQDLLATLLERVKQSPLDVTLDYSGSPLHGVALLSPFAQQIRSITLGTASRGDIEDLSAAVPGSLPLLHTLGIQDSRYDADRFARPPLFEGAVNLKKFVLQTPNPSSLSHYAFPNLTTFHFWIWGASKVLSVSLLLNFLEASPSLEEIDMDISKTISYEGVPLHKVLVLPRVKDFCLDITSDSFSWELAAHLSCPSAERAGFVCRLPSIHLNNSIPEDIYPPPLPWRAIVRRYTTGTVGRVEIELKLDKEITGSVIFWSSSEVALDLYYDHPIKIGGATDTELEEKIGTDIFSQACRTVLDHPLLSNVRGLYIIGGGLLAGNLDLAANDVGKLLGSMGPLEELVLDGCDMRPYLDTFFETPLFPEPTQPTSFPPIKKFAIIDPIQSLSDNEAYAAAVVELAKSQHSRGIPFEVVTLRPPAPDWVVVELLLLVNTVDCYEVVTSST